MPLSAEQLDLRRGRIGSSQVATIAGLNRESQIAVIAERTPFSVWLEVTGRSTSERTEASDEGHEFEDVIGRVAAAKIGILVGRNMNETLMVGEFGAATPDFWVYGDADGERIGVLEAKRVGYRVMRDWDDGVPSYVFAQVQWQMFVTGLKEGYVGAAIGGQPVYATTVPFDADFANGLNQVVYEWWCRHVRDDVPPDPDASDAARDWLQRKYTQLRPDLKQVPSNSATASLVAELAELKDRIKTDARRAKEVENLLLDFIGEDAGLEHELGTLKRSLCTGNTSWKQVALALADQHCVSDDDMAKLIDHNRGADYTRVNWRGR